VPQSFDRADLCVDELLRRVGRRLVVGLPIGIGKPVPLLNELYRRAVAEPDIELTLLTGLTLARPRAGDGAGNSLQRRFLEPFVERVFGNCQDPDYLEALRTNSLPANIRVIEFFLNPGQALDWPASQQNYLATNYTQVTRDVVARGINVVLTLVATRTQGGERQYSLGANPDVTAELMPLLRARVAAGEAVAVVGEVHPQLPFMLGDALVPAAGFDLLLEHPRYDYRLYGPPNLPISAVDHMIGLWCSGLLADGGTLQIGIGELGDALCYAALLRHQQNDLWRQAIDSAVPQTRAVLDESGGRNPFTRGLFACSEMFVDQLLDLYRAGVLRRRIHDLLPLERALAAGALGERFGPEVLERLLEHGLPPVIDAASFAQLQRCGILRSACTFRDGRIVTPEGVRVEADLSLPQVREKLAGSALGQRLQGGAVLEAAFLLGPQGFYAALRDLPEDQRALFRMCAVGRVNALGEQDRELKILQRRDARFINTAMMMTVLGAAISDGLEDGRVVSGVGGQLNFILQAMELPGARSILCLRSTRASRGQVQSNLRYGYGHLTVPRQMRDIVVTEYGVADLRGRTDAEVIAALLAICDSRFQEPLLREAQRHGKLPKDFRLPEVARGNTPQRIADILRPLQARGLFSEYPFGTDLTREEILIAQALRRLQAATRTAGGRAGTAVRALLTPLQAGHAAALERMGLQAVQGWRHRLDRRLLNWALRTP